MILNTTHPMNAERDNAIYLIDERSFTLLFNEHWEKLYAICYHNSRDMEVSRGMVQDIFRSLWEKRGHLQIHQPIEHYLLRAAKLKVCEYIRNKVSKENHLAAIQQNNTGSSNCTEETILGKDLDNQVYKLLDILPNQRKKVFKMSKEQGMNNKEIASALLISEKTVSYHLNKAKDFLQVNLSQAYKEQAAR